MSAFEKQVESTVAGLLTPHESVLEQSGGLDGLKPCVAVLTTRRLIFVRMGPTRFSDLRVSEVRLEDVLTVEATSGALNVDARSGVYRITGKGQFRKKVGQWPNLILEAQDALQQTAFSPVPARPGRASDLVGQLSHLSALRDTGALSEQEFTAAKGRLLEGSNPVGIQTAAQPVSTIYEGSEHIESDLTASLAQGVSVTELRETWDDWHESGRVSDGQRRVAFRILDDAEEWR